MPTPPILQLIVNGPLDADKMDYLWRDSYYTGVHYGRFDKERLINTLTVVLYLRQPSLGIDENGILSAEGLILARYYMFLQVYFHDIRRAYDFHLTDFLQAVLNDKTYPPELQEYLKYDDIYFEQLLNEYSNRSDELGDLAKRIVKRNFYKPVKEVELRRVDKAKYQNKLFDYNMRILQDEFKDTDFRKDQAIDSPNKFESEVFLYRKENSIGQDKYGSISDKTNLLEHLREFNILRLYVSKEDNFDNIRKRISELKWD